MEKQLEVKRHELKFYINQVDYHYAKSLLDELMQRDSHQKDPEGYFIRSLYLDDLYDTSVVEKLAGIENRDKYRLRIYDIDQDWVKLERKRKQNDYVQKTSAIISKKDSENIVKGDYDCLLKYKQQGAQSIYFDLKRKFIKPAVIVDYIRDAYMLDYNEIRITFDKKLRANDQDYDLFSPNIKTEPLLRDEVIIMEIKFNHFLPPWFPNLFKFESATKSAISKYCQSRLKTGDYSPI